MANGNPPMAPIVVPAAIKAERARQISGEGWDAAHDDAHDGGELLVVATLYWQHAIGIALPMEVRRQMRRTARGFRPPLIEEFAFTVPVRFPWHADWWKPRSRRRDLERAGALCLAEFDRLKRADLPVGHVEQKLEWIIAAYAVRRGVQ